MNKFFCGLVIFIFSAFKVYSFFPRDTNFYGGIGIGVDNFSRDLYFYERLKYQVFSGSGVVVLDHLALGGEVSLDARFLSGYTSYSRNFVSMLARGYAIGNLVEYSDSFELRDMSVSFRVYFNCFFMPDIALFSWIVFSGIKFGYMGFVSYPNDYLDSIVRKNSFNLGFDVGTRINLGFVFLEYVISPLFYNKSLLFNQMHKVSIGFIYQYNINSMYPYY
ncbi:hypothetical protein [Candidatus Borreliella tachyglossi]|uniref:hypothetical protein n=1 Tax=Candidatus Borreliella tachyglossi TaxID=1964448 RepID=UPI0040418B72